MKGDVIELEYDAEGRLGQVIWVTRLNFRSVANYIGRPWRELEADLCYSEEAGNHHMRVFHPFKEPEETMGNFEERHTIFDGKNNYSDPSTWTRPQGDEFFHSAMPAPEFDQDSTPIQKAIRLVYSYIKPRLEKTDRHVTFSEDEVYVVMFSYILGNWKALVSTTLPDGMYYEVTANSVAGEFYLDAYKKFDNVGFKA